MNDTQPTGLQLAVKLLAQIGDSDRAIAAVHAAADERDELRAKYDELLVALHGIGAALGIPEGDRSPYSVTCGVLERVNRLAEIEAQEPVATAWMKGGAMVNAFNCPPAAKFDHDGYWTSKGYSESPLYASPVPAQAVPMSDERIDAIAELVIKGMPDGICGFMRTWGYQQFARALLEVCAGHYRAQAVPDADGARFRWLCEDHSDRETRERCRSLIDRLPAMSYSDAVMSIDAAMAAAPEHKA